MLYLVLILFGIVGIFAFKMYVDNKHKNDTAIVKIGKKNMRINTTFYIEEVPIPFYTEEESEIEKTYNSLIKAPIVKVRDENTDLTKIDEKNKINVIKEFTNYKDIDTIIKELPNLPQEEVRSYLNQNKYEDLIKEDNKEQMYSVLLDLIVEENYPQIREWFKQRNITEDEFKSGIEKGEFLEWAQVHKNYYGTSLKPVLEALEAGKIVIFDIDVQGFHIALEKFKSYITSVFITTANKKELKRRLKNRGTDSDETIENRLMNAVGEMEHILEYDYFLVNDDIEKSYKGLKSILRAMRLKSAKINLRNVIDEWIDC